MNAYSIHTVNVDCEFNDLFNKHLKMSIRLNIIVRVGDRSIDRSSKRTFLFFLTFYYQPAQVLLYLHMGDRFVIIILRIVFFM